MSAGTESLIQALREGRSLQVSEDGLEAAVALWRAEEAKVARLRASYEKLAIWADEQVGNSFAGQVAMAARARLEEWDLPLDQWEP